MHKPCGECGSPDDVMQVLRQHYADKVKRKVGSWICRNCRKKLRKQYGSERPVLKMDELLDLRSEGKTWQECADHFGFSKSGIEMKARHAVAALWPGK